MKKINSIHYGSRVIAVGLVFLVLLPLALWGVNLWLQNEALITTAYVSMIIGAVIEIFFFVYLIIESKQDKKSEEDYQRHRKKKIPLPDGNTSAGIAATVTCAHRIPDVSHAGLRLRRRSEIQAPNP